MPRQITFQVHDLIFVCVIGLCLGWLTGMSASPVLGVVLTAMLGAAAALVSAFSGLPKSSEPEKAKLHLHITTALPLALLALFLVGGSILGILTRANRWLGPEPRTIAKYWKAQGLSLSESAILQRLFDRDNSAAAGNSSSRADEPWLFTAGAKLCDTLLRYAEPQNVVNLRLAMQQSGDPAIEKFANEVQDPQSLKAAVEVLICPEPASR